MDILLQRFLEHVRNTGLFCESDKILLAVSGGIDSVVMTDLFAKAGFNFGIAHCNFQLRGTDSDSDEEFVGYLAKKNQVTIHKITFDTQAYAKEHKLSIEEAARELRYNFFDKTAREHIYRYVATAHHNNDAIETFFINLIRGTGIAGLRGIPQKNGNIVRPLLPFSRQEIFEYASRNQLPYHEDYTNSETVFLRNKIRIGLIPLLKEISPNIEQTMRHNMAHIADAEQIFRNSIDEKRQQLFRYSDGLTFVAKSEIRKLLPCNTYMFELLRDFGFNAPTVNDLLLSLDNSGKCFLSATHTIVVDRHDIVIKNNSNEKSIEYQIPEGTEKIHNPITLIFKELNTAYTETPQSDKNTITADADKLQYPLTLRKWRPSDRFRPFGMKGTRKVSDFFKDNHLSLFEKAKKWLLCNADGKIIWIVGMRMDDFFRVDKHTKKTIEIFFTNNTL